MIAPFLHCKGYRLSGTVLIVTMWIVLVLAGLVLVFTHTVKVEAAAAANYHASRQAEVMARGGVDLARAIVAGEVESVDELYEAAEVGGCWMWMLNPDLDDDRVYHYGLVDLAARINLNCKRGANAQDYEKFYDMLMKLPEMTSELAAAIIDWQDANDEVFSGGAESEYYLLQPEPYQCKNASFESVEELLLVKGATYKLVYGEDVNRNGILDPNENDGDLSYPPDDGDGRLDRGLIAYITVHSLDVSEKKINVNQSEAYSQLTSLLDSVVDEDRRNTVKNLARVGRPFDSVIDFYYKTTLTRQEFDQIAGQISASNDEQQVGLININTAPVQVLACLPMLDESDAAALVGHRSSSADSELSQSIAWVVDVLSQEKASAIGAYITTISYHFAADIVTLAPNGRGYARRRVVIDNTEPSPRIVKHQDLAGLGWPLNRQIINGVRDDEKMEDILRKVER